MPKGLPQSVKDNIEKCRAAAIAAVDVYNRPGPRFRTAHYIVLIVLAWTALFHAIFYRKRMKPWYKIKGRNPRGDRYVHIDGEPKHWDISECLKQHFGGNNPPERKNLEFLIGLRNKIEHRHLPELDAGLYGECQAAILNLEELLTSEFGARYALAEQLAVSLQFTRLIPTEKRKAAKQLAAGVAKTVKDYVETFRGGLPSSILNSTKYSFSVFLVPKVANRKELADAAVEFVKVDEANKEELARLETLNVLIKEKHIPIANLSLHKPTQVVAKVQAKIPHKFTIASHTAAWHYFKVRPEAAAAKPEVTDAKYCVYDAVHKDYLYTDAWVEKLSNYLADPHAFQAVVGRAPVAN
jgi:desulfoferrodoxin (superoxide reductase-like protein)